MSVPSYHLLEEEVQLDILRLMATDPVFSNAAGHWVDPLYFPRDVHQEVARMMLEFYKTYSMPPTHSQVQSMLRERVSYGAIPKEDASRLQALLKRIYDEPLSGAREYTLDTIQRFARHRSWEQAIEASLPFLEAGEYDKVDEVMLGAQSAVVDMDAGGYWFFEAQEERQRRRGTEDEKKVYPTGILEIDFHLRRGGLVYPEVGIFMAPKGKGKSIGLGQVARRAIFEGGKVAFYSFEMATDQCADRMDSGFTGVPMWELKQDEETLQERLSTIGQRFPMSLMIKEYPTKSRTIDDIRRHLKTLERVHRWKPDMIVVDYAGIVKPKVFRDQRHIELQEIIEDFRGLCGEMQCVGWTAAQINRSGAKKETADGTDAAASWDQLATADYVFVINQTREERTRDELRLFVDKARDGRSEITIGPLQCDFARMTLARRSGKTPKQLRAEYKRRKEEARLKKEEKK